MLNLIVLRSRNLEQSVALYQALGLSFSQHSHGHGPEHYSAKVGSIVFEIYPLSENSGASAGARIGFSVADLNSVVDELASLGAKVLSPPKDSEWGRRAVVKDFDGHSLELVEALAQLELKK